MRCLSCSGGQLHAVIQSVTNRRQNRRSLLHIILYILSLSIPPAQHGKEQVEDRTMAGRGALAGVPILPLAVEMSSSFSADYPASNCIDGQYVTLCSTGLAANGWVSVQVPPSSQIHQAALFNRRDGARCGYDLGGGMLVGEGGLAAHVPRLP